MPPPGFAKSRQIGGQSRAGARNRCARLVHAALDWSSLVHPLLVADDSPVALLLLTRRLRAEGVLLVEASSVREARALDATKLAGALLDLDLGDGTGIDIARALRSVVPELPIAFFSAGATDELRASAHAFGTVFHKPADLEPAVVWAKALVSRA
jgi:DNA-binding response OmpR family regulator